MIIGIKLKQLKLLQEVLETKLLLFLTKKLPLIRQFFLSNVINCTK